MLPRMTMREINQQLSTINRIVIHPKYRAVGLGAKLIQVTLPQVGTSYVELIAVMAKYSWFAEKAGMQKVAEQQSTESISKVSMVLLELGFDLQLLGSERYVTGKLASLKSEQMSKLKEAFFSETLTPGSKESFTLTNINHLEKQRIILKQLNLRMI